MSKQQDVSEIRRKLLKAAVYAPPVILGSMVATPRTVLGVNKQGQGKTDECKYPKDPITGIKPPPTTIVISSGTNACCPCIEGSKDALKPDGAADCLEKQCIKSCGTNCAPGVMVTIKCKKFCEWCGSTPVGCDPGTTCTCTVTAVGKNTCI